MTIATAVVTALASANAVYTSTGNTAITFLSICNWSPADCTANLYIVPSAGSATTNNIVLSSLPLTQSDTYQLYLGAEKIILGPGDAIYMDATANITAVTSYTSL